MPETIYIYTTDKYGNPGAYLTTLAQLRADLEELVEGEEWEEPSQLREREWAIDQPPTVIDQDNDIIAEAATLEGLATYNVVRSGALWWEVVAREGWGLIAGLLEKRATFGVLRRALAVYRLLVERD